MFLFNERAKGLVLYRDKSDLEKIIGVEIFPNNRLLKISMYLSSVVGIWPIIFMDNKRLKSIYNAFSIVLYYYYLEYVLREFYQLTILLRAEQLNVEEILGNICINLLYTVSLLRRKALNSKKMATLFASIIETEERILSGTDPNILKIYMRCVKNNYIYNYLFIFNGCFVSILYLLRPLVTEYPTVVVNNETITLRVLPLSTWWPIDTQKYYWVCYFWSIFDGSLGSSFIINSDILTFSLIVYALSQLKVLSYKLKRFRRDVTRNKETFICLIKEHKRIIIFIDTFNETMKYVMLFDFLQSSLQLATLILQFMVVDVNIQNVTLNVDFLISMIMRLVIYYFNANEVIYQSQHLALDIWSADWHEQDKEVKKLILFFMARAQKPLKLLIGPFGVMSLETFISILRRSYSYMMLFLNTRE